MTKIKHDLCKKVCHDCLKEHEKGGYTCIWLSVENEYCDTLLILDKELSNNDK